MYDRARPYLPAIPYLVGVGLQVSGITNIPLSIFVCEIAALIAAAVMWSYWSDWRQTALTGAHPNKLVQRMLEWPGAKIPGIGKIPAQLFAAALVLAVCNTLIVAFINLAERRLEASRTQSAYAEQLKQFYTELGAIFWTQLPKDMTSEAYGEWQKRVEAKQDEVIGWVGSNMGPQAQQRLADVHHIPSVRRFTHAVNDKHHQLLMAIWAMQGNLKDMIETDVWDRQQR
jgi:hypothetical protein